MALSIRPNFLKSALASSLLAAIIGGLGWSAARRDNERRTERERCLTAELSAANELLISARQDLEAFHEATEKIVDDLETQISELKNARDSLSAQLNEKTNGPLVVPDGEIRWIDPVGKKVWINIGEADRVKAGQRFSVYKNTSSRIDDGQVKVAIGKQHLKGTIEVTRVLGDHLSEARIFNQDMYQPLAKGDFIFSPRWRPGRGEVISIVGIVDLDGDGLPDVDQFRKLVAAAGVSIDNEVDEEGTLLVDGKPPADGKPQVTERTKFIVGGGIPEIKDGDDPQTVDRIQKILDRRQELEGAARARGIRVIRLKDFLKYIGYKPQKRLFVPGGEVPYRLNSKSARAAVE